MLQELPVLILGLRTGAESFFVFVVFSILSHVQFLLKIAVRYIISHCALFHLWVYICL